MRDQYVGDISDLLKYSLLRTLAGSERRLGIGWYYNSEHDGRSDGHHIEYRSEDKWLALDNLVLRSLQGLTERSVAIVENLPIWPDGVRFHRVPVPNQSVRPEWNRGMAQDLDGCDLVFLDPDNGVGTTKRHATFEEVGSIRQPGKRALVVIKFPGRVPYDEQVDDYHQKLKDKVGVVDVVTLRTSVMVRGRGGAPVPRSRWFSLIDYDNILHMRLRTFRDRLNSIAGAKASIR